MATGATRPAAEIVLAADGRHGALRLLEAGLAGQVKGVRHKTAGSTPSGIDWDAALAAYNSVRPLHCRRVLTTARAWGELWHHEGEQREWRNAVMRQRDVRDYSLVDWLYGPTATTPDELAPMFCPAP